MPWFGERKKKVEERVAAEAPPSSSIDSIRQSGGEMASRPNEEDQHNSKGLSTLLDFNQEELGPLAGQIAMGTVFGYCSAYALRTVGRVMSFAVGAGFIGLQGLAYMGYVDVNWHRVERDYVKLLDLDQDGKVTAQDAQLLLGHVNQILQFNLPAGTGFTGGFLAGMGTSYTTAAGASAIYSLGARLVLPRLMLVGGAATGGPALFATAGDVFSAWPFHKGLFTGEMKFDEAGYKESLEGLRLSDLKTLEEKLVKEGASLEYGQEREREILLSKLSIIEEKKRTSKRGWFV